MSDRRHDGLAAGRPIKITHAVVLRLVFATIGGNAGPEAKELRKLTKKLRAIEKLAERPTASLLPEEVAKLAQKPAIEAEAATLENAIAAAAAAAAEAEGPADEPAAEAKDIPGRLALAREYLECAKRYPSASLSTMVFHTRRMCRELLKRYQLVHRCAAAKSLSDLKILVELCISHANASIPFECVVFWLDVHHAGCAGRPI